MPAEKSEKSGLSPKRLRFCQEYLVDLNGTQAAIRAGYSPRSANEQAARMLAQVSVAQYVQSQMDKRAAKLEVKAEDVLRDLDRIAHADIRKLFANDGTVKPPAEWPDDVASGGEAANRAGCSKSASGGCCNRTRPPETPRLRGPGSNQHQDKPPKPRSAHR
jgi:phage terminase small subunit